MALPVKVKLVEVGARDGLQNEKKPVPVSIKVEFINRLSTTGLTVIETTSFASSRKIPQFADNTEVFRKIIKKNTLTYPVLVPNVKGLETALSVGAEDITVFTTPSEKFSRYNTDCTVAESLQRIAEIMVVAKSQRLRVRGYISCVLGCPYQGEISPGIVIEIAEKLIGLGCYEISLADTIGAGTVIKIKQLLKLAKQKIPIEKIAVHFHDTYGQALINTYTALAQGVQVIDSAIAGLGGCPYAKGATGNLATEDLVYMLNGLGIETGVDLKKVLKVSEFITQYLGIETRSKVAQAFHAK